MQIIGAFLSYVGNHMLFDLYMRYNKKIFYAHHRAKAIKIQSDGSFVTTVERYTHEIVKDTDKTVKIMPKVEIVQFRSQNVVLGGGGKQKIKKSTLKKYEISKST